MKSSIGMQGLVTLAAALLVLAACANAPATSTDGAQAEAVKSMAQAAADETWVRQNWAALPQYYAENFVGYTNGVRDTVDTRQFVESLAPSWSDMKLTLDEVIVVGDRAIMRWTWFGTHKITGAAIAIQGVSLSRLQDGRFVDDWAYYDTLMPALAAGATLTPPPMPAATSGQ
jgi:hypothetical protein